MRPRLALLAAVLFGLAAAGGCRVLRPDRPPGTVDAPAFDSAGAARWGADALAGGPTAIARRLRRFGLPPVGADSVPLGWVAGRYPLRASELVVVAVEVGADAATLGAWLDVARLSSRLAPWRLYPEPTLLFAALGPDPQGGIDGLRRRALWAPDSVRAVVWIGSGSADGAAAAAAQWGARFVAVGATGTLGSRSARLFDAVRNQAWGLGAPSDTLRAQR